jgi:hypothetical protein
VSASELTVIVAARGRVQGECKSRAAVAAASATRILSTALIPAHEFCCAAAVALPGPLREIPGSRLTMVSHPIKASKRALPIARCCRCAGGWNAAASKGDSVTRKGALICVPRRSREATSLSLHVSASLDGPA